MESSVDQFLRRYVVRKRIVAVMFALSCAASVAIALLMLINRCLTPGARPAGLIAATVALLAIITQQLWVIFQKANPVTAAIDIERLRPEFDQRLITVASKPPESPLVDQLRSEVEAIAATIKIRTLVPMRLMWIALGVLAITLAFAGIEHG